MEWQDPGTELTGHVVICNCSEQLRGIVAELHAELVEERPDVALVVQDPEIWLENPAWHPDASNAFTRDHFFVLRAEAGVPLTERLRRVNVAGARAAVILADPRQGKLADARSTLVAVSIEKENPQVHTVMELIASVNRAHLRATEVNEVVCQGEIAEKLISQSCINPGVKNIFQSLLTNAPGTNNIYIIAHLPERALGMTYRELARELIVKRAPLILCGFMRPGAPEAERLSAPPPRLSKPPSIAAVECGEAAQLEFVINPRANEEPGRDTVLEECDQLIVISTRPPDLDEILG